jgi:hypothetical protein
MKIQLGKTFMWFLPGGKYHLSDNNPGPIEVDYDSLSPQEKTIVVQSIKSGKIVGELPEPKATVAPVQAPHISTLNMDLSDVSPIIVTSAEQREKLPREAERQANAMLAKTLGTIKKEIAGENNIRILRFALEEEKANRNRKTIVSALQSKIDYLSSQVITKIENAKPGPELKAHSKEEVLANSFSIEESEVEEITVRLE